MNRITAFFLHHSAERGGGSEQILYDIVHGLDPGSFRPILCCLYELGELGEQLRAEGCATYRNLVETPADPRKILRIASILRQERADILFVSDANFPVGCLAASLAKTPLSVLIFHSYPTVIRHGTPILRRAILGWLDRLTHPHADRVVALAENHKEYLVSTMNIPAERISVVYNGVDPDRFAGIDGSELRAALRVREGARIVGIVAGLRRWKAHDMFLTAAAAVLAEAPDTYFVVAGDGKERDRLKAMASRLNIAGHVRFLGTVANIPQLLGALDICVLSSIHEALPVALIEAMAAELPVVATDVGSVCEIVDQNVTGILVPCGDAPQFSQALLAILKNPKLGRQLGLAGRRKVEQEFTVDRMVHQYEELFTEWLGDSRESTQRPSRTGR